MSKIEDRLCEEFKWYCHNDIVADLACDDWQKRAEEGRLTYGVTLERTDLSKEDWFRHLKEELLDACNYATKLEMYEELTYIEKDILETLRRDLFHSLEAIYENSLLEYSLSKP